MKKNEKIYGRTIERKEDMQAQTIPADKPNKVPRKHYASVAERVAENSVSYRNFKYQGGMEAFPNEPTMRTVDQIYPYAIGGELLVDSPNTPSEIAACARKAAVLKKLGYRYLIVQADMDEFSAMEQLGE